MIERLVFKFPDPQRVKRLARDASLPEWLAAFFINRGLESFDEIKDFFRLKLKALSEITNGSPFEHAADQVLPSILEGGKIGILGDYDADGICSVALFIRFFRGMGLEVEYRIPDRFKHGYGFKKELLDDLVESGIDICFVVDSGTNDTQEISSSFRDLDVVVLDHHMPMSNYSTHGVTVINPNLFDLGGSFCSCGLVFLFLLTLKRRLANLKTKKLPNLKELLDLVAIATIADMVPLQGINRLMVKLGLDILNKKRRDFVYEILENAGLGRNYKLTEEDIAYYIAPRLNATGRMSNASIAVELLTTNDLNRIKEFSEELEHLNSKRERFQRKVIELIDLEISRMGRLPEILVFGDYGWHEGVVGIVAGRLVERYKRPAIVVAFREDGIGKGSARSIDGISIYEILKGASDLLEGFGGHKLAAGITIRRDRFESFKDRINKIAKGYIDIHKKRVILVDGWLPHALNNNNTIRFLNALSPFGFGNRPPLFVLETSHIDSYRKKGEHLFLNTDRSFGNLRLCWFNAPEWAEGLIVSRRGKLIVTPKVSEFRETLIVELRVIDATMEDRPDGG